MNKFIIMGRITRDLELKATPSGVAVYQFCVAVDRNYQKKGEEKKTDFFNVVTWREKAEFVCKYFGKGRMILIEGEMQTRQYTDKNGNSATWYEVIADNIYFTGEKTTRQEPPAELPPEPPAPSSSSQTEQTAPGAAVQATYGDESDDYPF